jgi:hypothetical protein
VVVWAFQHETTHPFTDLIRVTTAISHSTTRSTRQVVAAAAEGRDAAEQRVAGRSLVELDVLVGEALAHHVHDLGNDVSNLVVLHAVSTGSLTSHEWRAEG